MKIRKTKSNERSTYIYHFDNGETCKLVVGENGVTEADIKRLHSLDDSEVYYNNKNLRPGKTKEEKAAMEDYRKKYIEKTISERGYTPTKDEVEDAVKEQFPSNYNLSLDYIIGDEGEGTDKSRVLLEASLSMESSNLEDERLHEVMESMTELQRKALVRHYFEGYTFKMIGKEIGTSGVNASKHYNKAIKHIEDIYYKK